MPACWATPPHWVVPFRLSLAIHKPALVISMSSAPRPRPRVGLKVSAPVVGDRPSIPRAEMAPGPAKSHPFGFCDHLSCPPKYAVLVSAAVEYSESQPVELIHLWLTLVGVEG